jgi:hypothetical protein
LDEIIARLHWNEMDILKTLLVRHWLQVIHQERIWLLIVDEFLPFEINLLTFGLVELDTPLFEELIRYGIAKANVIRTAIGNRA